MRVSNLKAEDFTEQEKLAIAIGWEPRELASGARIWIPPGGFHAEPFPREIILDQNAIQRIWNAAGKARNDLYIYPVYHLEKYLWAAEWDNERVDIDGDPLPEFAVDTDFVHLLIKVIFGQTEAMDCYEMGEEIIKRPPPKPKKPQSKCSKPVRKIKEGDKITWEEITASVKEGVVNWVDKDGGEIEVKTGKKKEIIPLSYARLVVDTEKEGEKDD